MATHQKKAEKPSIKESEHDSQSPSLILAQRISQFLFERRTSKQYASYDISNRIEWRLLFSWADEAFGGTQSRGAWSSRDACDAMELGINLHLLQMDILKEDRTHTGHATKIVSNLKQILTLLPTQSKRTDEQQQFQQFSTPPHLGYIANWVADISSTDIFVEPSAGVGGLAVFAKLAGATVYVNELSERRYQLLQEIGFDGRFKENAEQLNNILPLEIKPTVIVMNPPFSSTAGLNIRSCGLPILVRGILIRNDFDRLSTGSVLFLLPKPWRLQRLEIVTGARILCKRPSTCLNRSVRCRQPSASPN